VKDRWLLNAEDEYSSLTQVAELAQLELFFCLLYFGNIYIYIYICIFNKVQKLIFENTRYFMDLRKF
ncbi:MAG: hypothetical protein N7Q72_05045, partial [Spiroplasma sp. Tabriz.8]|nr:hypothetical protein [Spiroplasma sp. Tabriz.8]